MGLTEGSGTFGVGVTMLLLGIGEVEALSWLGTGSVASMGSGVKVKGLGVTGQSTTGLVSELEDV
jgi:hypothetical protein